MLELQCLPVEVLCSIFDKLSGRERRPLHLVCRRWCEILATKHFVGTRTLKLTADNVDLLGHCDKFTSISIRDNDSSPKSVNRRIFLNALRRALFSEETNDQLEDLTLKDAQSDLLQELFGECDSEVCRLSNLKSLTICCFEYCDVSQIRAWNISKHLTKLHITVGKSEELRLIECVAEQLEELFVETNKLHLMLECCNVTGFEKLRTLKLKSDSFFPERFSCASEIGENFGRTLSRLRNLVIGFRHNDFLLGYAHVLRHCQKLRTLSILGADLCIEACNAIANLHCLRKLELLLRIEKGRGLRSWNLQSLEVLHTYVENLAPLGQHLPALSTIRISNHTIREGRFSVRPVERAYLQRYFTHFESITKLFLYDVYLEEDLLQQFPNMAAVKEIILRCVRTSSLVLDIIYERAPRVFKVYFWDCCFLVSPRAKIPSFEALRLLLPGACISHSSSKIIAVDYEQILS
ncbi:uncharacterized protein LOC110677198 [Aedes aegypti]|uniref:Uncharacterized protein n=1 Tax=Aedes aegypti TaxID=7159 RepID=A0A6I8U376_AEDAE|nr:uncharacterized protein LOC110677198 [Aedes aegypti]